MLKRIKPPIECIGCAHLYSSPYKGEIVSYCIYSLHRQQFGLPQRQRDDNGKIIKGSNGECLQKSNYPSQCGGYVKKTRKPRAGKHTGGRPALIVRCVETGQVYESVNEAARQTKTSVYHIQQSILLHVEKNGKHWEKVK